MNEDTIKQLKKLEGSYFTNTNSQAGKWLHYKLLKAEAGEITISVLVRNDMTNPNGHIHGGMISMICDEICGLSFFSLGKETYYTTANLIVDFLYGAPEGTLLTAKGKVLRTGKRMANVECFIYDEQENIIAHATSNLVNTDKKVFNLTP
ncbi:MAG: PaaI family thioesterase [Chitinophagaceae bacterium]|nr:MAG: thioesterase superfamily protein [Bacteroidetes bacterium OLB11]MCC6447953.1 PaaI family thioesterase [Chitinophagaceae bacterium]HMN32994.1 PaaI family thioesterase [Chitinophagaceae bacterium]